jgi:hypothetical protein
MTIFYCIGIHVSASDRRIDYSIAWSFGLQIQALHDIFSEAKLYPS